MLFYISSDAVWAWFLHKVSCVSCLFKLLFKIASFKFQKRLDACRTYGDGEFMKATWNHFECSNWTNFSFLKRPKMTDDSFFFDVHIYKYIYIYILFICHWILGTQSFWAILIFFSTAMKPGDAAGVAIAARSLMPEEWQDSFDAWTLGMATTLDRCGWPNPLKQHREAQARFTNCLVALPSMLSTPWSKSKYSGNWATDTRWRLKSC